MEDTPGGVLLSQGSLEVGNGLGLVGGFFFAAGNDEGVAEEGRVRSCMLATLAAPAVGGIVLAVMECASDNASECPSAFGRTVDARFPCIAGASA